ncbi:hypothetical protein ACTWPT_12085 [Nonomuraea sp. 3N208]|uniref:hypothetical protein n=1 Tax=Nonomuraea sp. 3N208 TaxID=3457421 RepID=UPI003FCE3546
MRRAVAPVLMTLAALTACGTQENAAAPPSSTPSRSDQEALTDVAAVARILDTQLTKHKSLKIAVSVTGDESAVKADVIVSLRGKGADVDMTSEDPASPGQKTRVIESGDSTYVAVTDDLADMAEGKAWLRFGEKQKGMLALLAPGAAGSAVADLNLARNAGLYTSGTLSSAQDPLGTRYTITYDFAGALKKFGAKKYVELNFDQSLAAVKAALPENGLKKVMKGVSGLGDAYNARLGAQLMKAAKGVTATYDLWVNGNGLPAKLVMNVPLEGAAVKTEMAFSSWGQAEVTVPAKEETAAVPSL